MQIRALTTPQELTARRQLLNARGLGWMPCDHAWGVFEGEELLATLGVKDDTLLGLAVVPSRKGEGLATRLVECAVSACFLRGADNVRVFTRRTTADQLQAMGFHPVEATDKVALLEWNETFSRQLDRWAALGRKSPLKGAVVMNGNPFTIGHRYLAERAAASEGGAFVMVVSSDASEFSCADRLAIASEALSDLSRIRVVPAGPYVVSLATFPSYFTREAELARTHAELDARLFVRQARALGVVRRWVGTEPLSASTRVYNDVLKRILPQAGIEVVECPRLEWGRVPVSASAVRKNLAGGRTDAALELIPRRVQAMVLQAWRQKEKN